MSTAMALKKVLLLSVVFAHQALSAPVLEPRIFQTISTRDTAILFDAPAFQDPKNPNNFIASFRVFAFKNLIDISDVVDDLVDFIEGFGINVGDSLSILEDHAQLFGAIGLPFKEIPVKIDGCSIEAELDETELLPNLGMLERDINIGTCKSGSLNALVDLESPDTRKFQGVVFPSPPNGFGIISDIDDTIKISNVLDTVATIKSTFLEEPKFVPGMPDLYKSLKTTLQSPQFIYLSGSPFQLYPTLRKFINTSYQPGPILLQNLTFINIPGVVNFIQGATFDFKSERINAIHGWYPAKKFLSIGDSTQSDPEIYAAAFKRFGGNFIQCIWIRKVEGAANSNERFAAAFAGVPVNNFRVFTDPAELMNINVAGGEC